MYLGILVVGCVPRHATLVFQLVVLYQLFKLVVPHLGVLAVLLVLCTKYFSYCVSSSCQVSGGVSSSCQVSGGVK